MAILFDNKVRVCRLAQLSDKLETHHVDCVWSPPPSPPPPLVENTDIKPMSNVQAKNINDDNDDASFSVLTTESGTMNSKTKRRRRVVFKSFCWEQNNRLLVGANNGSVVIFDGPLTSC